MCMQLMMQIKTNIFRNWCSFNMTILLYFLSEFYELKNWTKKEGTYCRIDQVYVAMTGPFRRCMSMSICCAKQLPVILVRSIIIINNYSLTSVYVYYYSINISVVHFELFLINFYLVHKFESYQPIEWVHITIPSIFDKCIDPLIVSHVWYKDYQIHPYIHCQPSLMQFFFL